MSCRNIDSTNVLLHTDRCLPPSLSADELTNLARLQTASPSTYPTGAGVRPTSQAPSSAASGRCHASSCSSTRQSRWAAGRMGRVRMRRWRRRVGRRGARRARRRLWPTTSRASRCGLLPAATTHAAAFCLLSSVCSVDALCGSAGIPGIVAAVDDAMSVLMSCLNRSRRPLSDPGSLCLLWQLA